MPTFYSHVQPYKRGSIPNVDFYQQNGGTRPIHISPSVRHLNMSQIPQPYNGYFDNGDMTEWLNNIKTKIWDELQFGDTSCIEWIDALIDEKQNGNDYSIDEIQNILHDVRRYLISRDKKVRIPYVTLQNGMRI